MLYILFAGITFIDLKLIKTPDHRQHFGVAVVPGVKVGLFFDDEAPKEARK